MPPISIQIDPEHWKIVQDILQKYLPYHKVWAFGSRAKGCANELSDLDIIVDSQEELPLLLMAELREAFSESLLPWNVDVIDSFTCSSEFFNYIEKDMVNIWNPVKP